MNGSSPSSSNIDRVLALFLFCCIQIAGVFYYAYYFHTNGYLPSPFVYDKSDTFMDLFNTMWWSDNGQQYVEWGAVYPPLNFVLLKVLKWAFLGNESFADPLALREAAYAIEVFFVSLYLIIPILVLKTKLWKNISLTEMTLIYLGLVLSTPMLFALERGNLIILTLILLALALSNPGFVRAMSIAVLINLKPYFALLLVHYAIKRRWDDLILCILLSGLLFFITGLLLNDHFMLFFKNLFSFSQSESIFSLREVMSMPSSISAFSYVLNSSNFQSSRFYSQLPNPAALASLIEFTKWFILAAAISVLFLRWKHLSDEKVIAVLIVVIVNLGTWVGGYSMIFYATLVPIFLKMKYRYVYLGILFMILIPIDIYPLIEEFIGYQYAYLSDSLLQVNWTMGIGSFTTPSLNMLLLVSLIYEMVYGTKENHGNIPFPLAWKLFKLGVS